jgi:hypothetical protein
MEAAYPGKFKLVAVSVDETWQAVGQFFGGQPVAGGLVARDLDESATRAYFCTARGSCPQNFQFPETYVIDRNGRLVAYIAGPADWADPTAWRFVEKLIRG